MEIHQIHCASFLSIHNKEMRLPPLYILRIIIRSLKDFNVALKFVLYGLLEMYACMADVFTSFALSLKSQFSYCLE